MRIACAYHGGGSRLQRRGRRRLAAAVLAGPRGERCPQEPGEPLLAGAPEVLHVVVRPPRQVGGDPRPLVPELRLQLQHHALLLGRELAATVAKSSITTVNSRSTEHKMQAATN
jgi:hypothetical protein